MNTPIDEEDLLREKHLALLTSSSIHQDQHEVASTPVFTTPILKHARASFNQYGFLAGLSNILDVNAGRGKEQPGEDPRIFFNISAPSSAFICGSQGSGKSHTLSCLLENCLMKSDVSTLDSPLAGLVFHYDNFASDDRGTPCEAAYLSSHPNIKVRVLCARTSLEVIKKTYAGMNVQVEELCIDQTDLNTKRMLDLMAVNTEDRMPLYLHAINRILRDLRMVQQKTGEKFNYAEFKRQVMATDMTAAQLAPLNQRLETLESFMPKSQVAVPAATALKKKAAKNVAVEGNNWDVKAGTLTIIDLSCPMITSEGACALFNMCLSIFLEQKTTIGRIIALDEAHKYMNDAAEANALTNTLLSSIRLQRHLGTRVFISTQEPTISPKLLDLCSITVAHRFTSPDWLQCLKQHLAALSKTPDDSDAARVSAAPAVFDQIVQLRVGEALLFCPSAIIDLEVPASDGRHAPQMLKLGVGSLKVRIRGRVTTDGGRSVLAMGTFASKPAQENGGTEAEAKIEVEEVDGANTSSTQATTPAEPSAV